jgi:hypothetical protein
MRIKDRIRSKFTDAAVAGTTVDGLNDVKQVLNAARIEVTPKPG